MGSEVDRTTLAWAMICCSLGPCNTSRWVTPPSLSFLICKIEMINSGFTGVFQRSNRITDMQVPCELWSVLQTAGNCCCDAEDLSIGWVYSYSCLENNSLLTQKVESYLCSMEDAGTENIKQNKQESIFFRNITWTLDKYVGRKCFWDTGRDWSPGDNRGRLPGGGKQGVEGRQGVG